MVVLLYRSPRAVDRRAVAPDTAARWPYPWASPRQPMSTRVLRMVIPTVGDGHTPGPDLPRRFSDPGTSCTGGRAAHDGRPHCRA